MKTQVMNKNCTNCSRVTLFRLTGYYQDGSQRFICECCENNGGVLHSSPQDHPVAAPKWLPLLLAGVDIVCPECKAAYDLGLKISPSYPTLGGVLEVAGLLVGSILVIATIDEFLRRPKRRR